VTDTPGTHADARDEPTIERVDRATPELVDAFARLIPQLSTSSPPPTLDELDAVIADPNNAVFVARLGGRIVGSTTLVTFRIPTGPKSWIEDVVVDDEARGLGIGELLNRAALDEARRRRVKAVSLTSRASREAANRLYRRIGFEHRETNYYRIDL
jgi:ribosomal protein S18 acetylase RimI-like enzyme